MANFEIKPKCERRKEMLIDKLMLIIENIKEIKKNTEVKKNGR